MANTSKTKDKVENPEAHFAKPKQVVKDNVLSRDDKKNALNTWEQDERQLLTASNEGMSGRDEGLRVDNDNRLGERHRRHQGHTARQVEIPCCVSKNRAPSGALFFMRASMPSF